MAIAINSSKLINKTNKENISERAAWQSAAQHSVYSQKEYTTLKSVSSKRRCLGPTPSGYPGSTRRDVSLPRGGTTLRNRQPLG